MITKTKRERWEYVTRRDGCCIRCKQHIGQYEYLSPHHVIPVRNNKGRWETDNIVSTCHKCHRWLDVRGDEQELFCAMYFISIGLFETVEKWYEFKRKIKGYE